MDYPIRFAEQLSQHLRSFRKNRNLTQTQLAQLLGLTQSRIAELEAAPERTSVDNLLRLLAALKVDLVLRDAESASSFHAAQPRADYQTGDGW